MENNQDRYTGDTQPLRFHKVPERQESDVTDTGLEPQEPVVGQESEADAELEPQETVVRDRPEADTGLELPETETRRPWPYEMSAVEQDQIPTPVPVVVPNDVAAATRSRPASKALWALVILSLIIGIASLSLNAVIILRFLEVRQMVIKNVDEAIAALDKLGNEGFHYEYHFNQTIPFSGNIPFKQDMMFPFKGNIPIDTVFKVPIDAGPLGQFTLDVPIDTSFYVDLEVPVSVDQTIPVDTEIPLDMVIPIDIQVDDPLIQDAIDQIRGRLVELRDSF